MKARRAVFNDINITPLTDIFLVLLVIMMVVAPMLNTSGLKLSVPSAGPSAEAKEDPKVTKVLISADGEFTIGEQKVSGGMLESEIKRLNAEHPDGVIIETDPAASHEVLTLAMDAVQSAGVSKLAVTSSKPIDESGEP